MTQQHPAAPPLQDPPLDPAAVDAARAPEPRPRCSGSSCSSSCRSWPCSPRSRWPGVGPGLARPGAARRHLRHDGRRHHRRLPPLLHPRRRSRPSRPLRIDAGRRRLATRSRARWTAGSPTTAGTTRSATGGRPALAVAVRRAPRRRCPRACSTPTWAGCSTSSRPRGASTPPTCSRTATCVRISRAFPGWSSAARCSSRRCSAGCSPGRGGAR